MHAVTVPEFWEPLLKRYVKETFYPGTRREDFAGREGFTEGDERFFAKGVARLNLAFTRERSSLPKNYFNQKELRSGYLLYFLPVNALKVAALLSQTSPLTPGEVKILDIGSGPGTGMMGTVLYLESLLQGRDSGAIDLQWLLVDQNREVLRDATRLYERVLARLRETHPTWEIRSELRTIVADLSSPRLSQTLPREQADLILCLNVLSEFSPARRLPLVGRLLKDFLHEEGKILVVEPALQRTTRDLMAFRDELVRRRLGFVYAPCLHQADCPMLQVNQRDWCHTYLPWERPLWLERIDRLVGIKKDYLKCSYLLVGKEPPPVPSHETWRVVSGHLNSRGKSEILLCGPGALPNLQRVTRLDRDRSLANEWFDHLARGDLLILPKLGRVNKDTTI